MNEEFWIGEHPIVASELNLPNEAVHAMDPGTFSSWAQSVRCSLGAWQKEGIPPHDGTSTDEIEHDMRSLSFRDTTNFLQFDSETGRSNVIVDGGRNGSHLRCLFTNMGESGDGNAGGASLYDYITADETSDPGKKLCQEWERKLNRIVRRDTMYEYSKTLKPNSVEAMGASNGAEWVQQPAAAGVEEHWASYRVENSEKVRDTTELTLTVNDAYMLARFRRIKPENAGFDPSLDAETFGRALIGGKPNGPVFTFDKMKPFRPQAKHFRIRTFRPNERVFPRAFALLRTGMVAQGTNFPALTAKCLYQAYTEQFRSSGREIIVFDPSMGYGGRCLGAMAAACDRPIRYIGTDPNSKHWVTPERSRYDILADYYRASVGQRFHATVQAFCCGSEDIHKNLAFQKYQGQIDLVFTSPPYFCAEIYSREATQSAIKFSSYDTWRDGFLRPTLKTCVDYLRPGGILLWNIADVKVGSHYVPLELDSISALTEFGMVMTDKLKMPLATAPGRKFLDGLPTTKNYLTLRGNYRKYEPIFVFRKPT